MAASRKRFKGTSDDVVAALQPAVGQLGRSFIRYDESMETSKAKVDPVAISKCYPFLAALHSVQDNLSFSRALWDEVIRKLYKANESQPHWKLKPADEAGYFDVMVRRCCNICRAVQQSSSLKKGKAQPQWVKELPWNKAAADTTAETAKTEAKKEYVYGWSDELKQAWRMSTAEKDPQMKEMSASIEVGKEDQAVTAVFRDGGRWQVSDLSAADYMAPRSKNTGCTYWTGTHPLTHNRVVVRRKHDGRNMLVVLREQNRQLLQCAWINNEETPTVELMTDLAKQYVDGKLDKNQLTDTRNKRLLDDFGMKITTRGKNNGDSVGQWASDPPPRSSFRDVGTPCTRSIWGGWMGAHVGCEQCAIAFLIAFVLQVAKKRPSAATEEARTCLHDDSYSFRLFPTIGTI